MNTRDTSAIPDVQSSEDTRRIAIDRVGIKAIRHPIKVAERGGGTQHTVAMFNMYVGLPHNFKGTHMSRFVEILNAHEREISVDTFKLMLGEMMDRLEAQSGVIEMTFPYFINKAAPVSKVQSLMDYEVTFSGEVRDGRKMFTMKVVVPVTSLCPCSKGISDYGAHNQRSHVTISARTNGFVWIEELVEQLNTVFLEAERIAGARRRRRTQPERPHRMVCGGVGELRIHPQSQRLRADRVRQAEKSLSR